MPSKPTSTKSSLKKSNKERTIPVLQNIHAVSEYVKFYNYERPHQGANNELVVPEFREIETEGGVKIRSRLGGLLTFYYR